MRKTYFLPVLLLSLAVMTANVQAQTQTVVFTDNFDHSTFVTGTAYGSPATTYKFTLGGTSTITTTLVSGSNYKATINSGSTANRSLFYAPLAPYAAPNTVFSRELSANYGLVTWTFNMRTSTAVTTSSPTSGAMSGGIDLCGNAAGNIYNGAPTGYGVVFNSSATGGVNLVRFSAGMLTNVTLITGTTTMSKTDYYSVRVTYDPATNQWSLYVRDDGTTGFADPSTGVTTQQGSTVTDATYTNNVMVNFGAVYCFTAGTGKTMSIDNYQVSVLLPACNTPGLPSGLSYSNTATGTSVSFTPPSPAPSGYILVMSSGALVGAPTTGQAITVGTSVGTNGTIVGAGSGSLVTTSWPLTANTTYTMTFFPYNNTGCTPGPVFNTSAPSTTITTCPNPPTLTGFGTPTSNTIPSVTWSPPAAGGGVYGAYTYLLNVYTDPGLTVPATGYPSGGTIVTSPFNITGLTSGVTYYWTVSALDSACTSVPSAANNVATSVVPCSGYPNAGSTSSSSYQVTGGTSFTLGLVGASGETGVSFQWQSSSCGTGWTNIGSPLTVPGYSTTESTPTFYQCVVTCANSGLTSLSNPVYVSRINTTYCFPTSTNGCSIGDGVNEFTLTGACSTSINDAGPLVCSGINLDHTSLTPVKLFAGSSYAATVNSNDDGDDVYVWIDFNNDGLFSSSEIVYSTTTAVVPALPFVYSFNIPIPAVSAGATPGLHRMRVVVNNAQVLSTGCDALTYGTSVDYLVQILPALSLSYNSPVCLPGGLTLTASPALSCGSVYSWSGPSGYTSVTMNTNTVSPPAVAGIYSVSVTVNGVNSCPVPATTNVTVYTTPSISGANGMCVGSTATLSGSPTGGNWASSNASVASVGSGTGLVTGVTLGTATVSYTIPASGCFTTRPMGITPTPNVYTVTGGGSYCSGGSGVHVGLNSSDAGVSYQLYNSGVPVGSPVTGTGLALDFGLETTAGNYTVTGNPGTSCSTAMAGSVAVSVLALPTAYNVTGGGNYCPGTSGNHVGLSGSQSGINYQLYLNGIATGLPVTGTGPAIDFGLQTGSGTYNITATSLTNSCSQVMTDSVVIGLNAAPALYAVTGGGPYCSGGTGVHIGLGNSATGTTYRLYTGGTPYGSSFAGTGVALDLGSVPVAGTYTVLATITATGCTATMIGDAVVSVSPAPAPFAVTGGGAYCAGGAGLHIGVGGSLLGTSYSLYNGGSLVSTVSGTGSSLDFGIQASAGTYTVTAALALTGCTGPMTGSPVITINTLPFAYAVTGGGSYCAGTAAPHVYLGGSSGTVSYQLFRGGSPVGAALTGTGSSLDFGVQAIAGNYSVIATTVSSGCTNGMAGGVSVSVNPAPSGYLVTGGGSFCSGGTGVHVGLINTDSGVSYQLRNGGVNTGSPVFGAAGPIDFGLQISGGTYTVLATSNTTLCSVVMPGTSVVTVKPLPNVYLMTGGGNYCAGGTGKHIGLSGSDAGINYQLYNGALAAGPAAGGSGASLDFGLQTGTGTYTVQATNAVTGCSNSMSGSEIIGISPLPVAFAVTGGGSICPAGAGAHIGLSSSAAGVSYQLYNGTSTAGLAMTGTGAAIDFGAQTATGTYTVVGTITAGSCASLMTGSAVINSSPVPASHTVTGGGSYYCVGGTGVHIGLNGSESGNTYQLYRGGLMAGTPIAGTGFAVDFGLQTLSGSYSVVATSISTGCNSTMSGTAVVVVDGQPAIHVMTGGGNYCPGSGGVHIGLNGSETGIVYQLYEGTATSGSVLGGTGSAVDFGLRTSAGTYSVLATNTATGCSVSMAGTATVGVGTLPLVYSVTGSGSYCANSTGVPVLLSSSDAGINYQLYRNGVATTATIAGTGGPLDFGQQTAGVYTVNAASIATGCSNNMDGSAIVTANALPDTFMVSGGGAYCSGGPGVHISLSGSEMGVSYRLTNGVTAGSPFAGTGSALDFGLVTAGGTYTVIAAQALTGCMDNMADSAVVNTLALPVGYTVTGGGNYCVTGIGLHVGLSGSNSGITYQLFQGGVAIGVPLFGTGSPLDFGLQTVTGAYTVRATDLTSTCSSAMTGTADVGTYPLPVAFAVTGGGTFCAGEPGAHIGLAGSETGVSYQLNFTGSPSGAAIAGTGIGLDFGAQSSAGTYAVSAVNVATGCTNNMTGSANVTEGATPAVFTVSGSGSGYCAGGAGVTVFLSNSEPGVSYQLYRGTSAAGVPVAGTGGALSFGPQLLAGTYTVSGHSVLAGCISNMSGGVDISVNPLPAIYNVTGGGGFCSGGAGAHIGLTGSSTGVTYQVYHLGVPVGLSVAGTGGPLDLGAQTLPGSYSVVATGISTGCTSNMAGTAMVFVNAAPAVYTVTGGGSYCSGGSGVHTGISGSASGAMYQLFINGTASGTSWSGSGLPVDFGLQTVSGVYTVVATDIASGCEASMAGAANVSPVSLPVSHPVSGGGNYCSGGTGVHVSITGSNGGVVYQLFNGSTATGTPVAGTGYAIDFGAQTAAGIYTVIGTDGTTSCHNAMAGSVAVNVNPLPDIFAVTGGGNYCAGGAGVNVGLASSVTGISYGLYFGSALVTSTTGTGAPLSFGLQTGAGSYTIRATNPATSCDNTMTGSATVGVTPVVVPSVSISTGSGDTLCSGNLTPFTAVGTNGGSTPGYAWSVNGIPVSTAMVYSYVPANGDVVTLTFSSSAACATPMTASASSLITILEKELPVVSISANPGVEVCLGTSVEFTAAPSYGGSLPSFVWMKGGAVISSGPSLTYTPTAGDIITCKMISNYQCRTANSVVSTPTLMIVDTPGTPLVTIAAYPGLSISAGQTLSFSASVTAAGPAPLYQWSVNGVEVPGATLPTYSSNTLSNNDIVACHVTSSGGCAGSIGGSSVTVHVSGVGVAPVPNGNSDIRVLPNPNKGVFTITGTIGTQDHSVLIEIRNMLGQQIYSGVASVDNGRIHETIRLDNSIAAGIYLVSVHTQSADSVFHMVIEK